MSSLSIADKISKWEFFKSTLPHVQAPYNKRNWGSSLHSVCSYQGKMKPSLAHHLIKTFSIEGEVVLDPFSGSGTIPFEAALNKRIGLAMDIAHLPVALTNAKIKTHDKAELDKILDKLAKYIECHEPSLKTLKDSQEVGFNKKIEEYYHPDTFNEVLCARDFFLKYASPELENWSLVFACLLHILHGNRPYALSRNSHPILPYAPTGDFVYKNLVEKLRVKVYKSIDEQNKLDMTPSFCLKGNILEEWPKVIRNVDVIITSPPFFNSTKFYMSNWLRYWFCGWGKEDFKDKPSAFVENQQKKDFDIYDFIFKECNKSLKSDGIILMHLGHSNKCNMANMLEPYARKYFKIIDIFNESVEHCEKHGIKDKGAIKEHQYLVLSK